MLSAGAAEVYHQVLKTSGDVIFNSLIHNIIHISQEESRFWLTVEPGGNFWIEAAELSEACITAGVGQCPAIEHKSATVACFIRRDS